MVSSMSTTTTSPTPETTGVSAANPVRNLEATASSWRTCPKVKVHRNEPNVEGAYPQEKDPSHPTVAQDRHVVDAVGAGDHPRDERADLRAGVGALVRGHAQALIRQRAQARGLGHRRIGTSPADPVRFGSSNTADVAAGV